MNSIFTRIMQAVAVKREKPAEDREPGPQPVREPEPEPHEAKVIDQRITDYPEGESPYDKLERAERRARERFMRDEDEDEANPRSLVDAFRPKY